MVLKFITKFEAIRPFTEAEAWGLFKIAALSEAFGWTLLIGGILIRHYQLWGWQAAVPVAGQIHGMIFLGYFGILIATYSSLRWPRMKFLLAILAGIPPYGSLIFELWASHLRKSKRRQVFFRSLLPVALINK